MSLDKRAHPATHQNALLSQWRELVMGLAWLILLLIMKEAGKRNKCVRARV